jgi:hypothetical protein
MLAWARLVKIPRCLERRVADICRRDKTPSALLPTLFSTSLTGFATSNTNQRQLVLFYWNVIDLVNQGQLIEPTFNQMVYS